MKRFSLTGFNEVRYSEKEKKLFMNQSNLNNYRNFDFESPWEGTEYIKQIKDKERMAKN